MKEKDNIYSSHPCSLSIRSHNVRVGKMSFSNIDVKFLLMLKFLLLATEKEFFVLPDSRAQPRSQGPFSTSRSRERILGTRLSMALVCTLISIGDVINIFAIRRTSLEIDHFTTVSLVAWPLNGSEAGGDLAFIETSLFFLC